MQSITEPYRRKSKNTSIILWVFVVIAVAFLAVLFVCLSSPLAASPTFLNVSFVTAEDIEDAKKEKAETEAKIEEAKKTVEALNGDVDELSLELANLQGLSDEQWTQYREIAEELATALIAKNAAIDAYLESQETLEIKKAEYSERISVMFEFQNKSTLEILLESENLAGFFTNLELIELIGDSDQQIMDEMQAVLDDADLKSQNALQEAQDMQTVAEKKQEELAELEAMIGETEDTLDRTQTELSEWERKQDEMEQASEDIAREIVQLQRMMNAGSGSPGEAPPQGSMTWPYPGDYYIYSPFGMRWHPLSNKWKMHYGVDLGGSYGKPIVAAADGEVILVRELVPDQNTGGGNGYGNYLVIDHGGYVSTLYAHCKSIYVSVGDTVVAGQKIAACGSTGGSTGAHLHFEVIEGSTKVDPELYIT